MLESEPTDTTALVPEQAHGAGKTGSSLEEDVVSAHVPWRLQATPRRQRFEWLALEVVAVLGVLFALIARLSAQPSTSLVPIAVLSATGCGLLVTGIRKLRTLQRPGLAEATLGGLVLALCHFLAAVSYPGVFSTLVSQPEQRLAFLSTWGLIAACSLIFSLAGAALGHLAFAPLRPLPAHLGVAEQEVAGPLEDEAEADEALQAETERVREAEQPAEEEAEAGEEVEAAAVPEEALLQEEETPEKPAPVPVARRSLLSYLVTVLLLALLPTLAGYVFAAAYDAMFTIYQFAPGPFPTLRLLAATLPWQVPLPIDLSRPDASLIIFALLWRIPLFLGNAGSFDALALEPVILNGAALALLLLSTCGREEASGVAAQDQEKMRPGGSHYLWLLAFLGLMLVLPPDLWVFQGLAGLLQIPQLNLALPLRTLRILDLRAFALNLLTAPLVCLLLAWLLRRQYARATRFIHTRSERETVNE